MSSEQLMARLQSKLDEKQAAQEAARQGGGNGDYTGVMTLKFGDQNVFILPPFAQGHDLNHEVWLHFGFTDAQGNNAVYQCSKGKHGSCPICDSIAHLKDSQNKAEKDQYQSMCAKKFYIYNVLNDKAENKILCAKSSQQEAIDAEILATFKIDKTDVTSLTNGRWLQVSRLRVQPWCRVRTLNQPYVLTPEQQAVVCSKMKDLRSYYRDYTPAELAKVLRGEPVDQPQSATPQPATAPSPTVAPQPVAAPQPTAVPTPTPTPAAAPAPQVATAPSPFAEPLVAPAAAQTAQTPVQPAAQAPMSAQEILARLNS